MDSTKAILGLCNMANTQKIKRFGPLFYTTLVVSLAILIGFYINQARVEYSRNNISSHYFEDLGSTDQNKLLNAFNELQAIDADCTEALVELLAHEDPGFRQFAATGLGSL